MSRYKIQHGAHRVYQVPESMVLHEAEKGMPVCNGKHIGEMVASRAAPKWKGLKWFNVHIVGGNNHTTGKVEKGPFVCFIPPDNCKTDDADWMRPIPAKVMSFYQPLWEAEIKQMHSGIFMDKVFDKFKSVFAWNDSMLSGQRIDPQKFGNGEDVFVLSTTKLKSIRVAPEVVPRKTQMNEGQQAKHKLTSAICKSASSIARKHQLSSTVHTDVASEASDATSIVEARTIRIGPVTTTSTFVLDGVVYATTLG